MEVELVDAVAVVAMMEVEDEQGRNRANAYYYDAQSEIRR